MSDGCASGHTTRHRPNSSALRRKLRSPLSSTTTRSFSHQNKWQCSQTSRIQLLVWECSTDYRKPWNPSNECPSRFAREWASTTTATGLMAQWESSAASSRGTMRISSPSCCRQWGWSTCCVRVPTLPTLVAALVVRCCEWQRSFRSPTSWDTTSRSTPSRAPTNASVRLVLPTLVLPIHKLNLCPPTTASISCALSTAFTT